MNDSFSTLQTPWGTQVLAEPHASAPIGVFDSGVGGLNGGASHYGSATQ